MEQVVIYRHFNQTTGGGVEKDTREETGLTLSEYLRKTGFTSYDEANETMSRGGQHIRVEEKAG